MTISDTVTQSCFQSLNEVPRNIRTGYRAASPRRFGGAVAAREAECELVTKVVVKVDGQIIATYVCMHVCTYSLAAY